MSAVPVPPSVAEVARAALAERAANEGIEGATRQAVVCALELAQSPFVPEDTLALVGAWHAANPHATTAEGRCTRLAGLYGGAAGKAWALASDVVPTVSWLQEESATLEGFSAGDRGYTAAPAPAAAPSAAGLAVIAKDTGRVLMLQRALNEDDPASGTWEFPGGGIDDGETPWAAAHREFAEETGVAAPGRPSYQGWVSPNGVYHLYAHVVPSEADLPINVDHGDRHVLNPDDPDGDCIETLCWWDPPHAAANPALRDECGWTPWADLSALAANVPMTAAVSDRQAALDKLAGIVRRADERLRERTYAAAQVAMKDALRRAGSKVHQRATRKGNAVKAAVAAAGGRWTDPVLAAVGLHEHELLHQAFLSLGDRFEGWAHDANRRKIDAVAATLGIAGAGLYARMKATIADNVRAARARLDADLTAQATRLLAEPEPTFDQRGEQPVDATLPLAIIGAALALADGRQPDAPERGDGIVIQAWATEADNPPIEQVAWTWGGSEHPFPPHEDLDGTEATWDTYDNVFAKDDGEFPYGTTSWYAGDHVGCVPAGTVVSAWAPSGYSLRWYEGEIIELTTTSGEFLAATPNHPVLTTDGWVPAGLLHEGSDVIRCVDAERVAALIPHDHYGPALIEEVVDAFRVSLPVEACAVPVTAEDFHGDGRGSEIAVVGTDRVLVRREDVPLGQPGREARLIGPDADLAFVASTGTLNPTVERVGSAAFGGMCGGDDLHAALGCPASRDDSSLFVERAEDHAAFTEAAGDDGAGNTDLVRHLLDGVASVVTPDKLVHVDRKSFAGHVYNLTDTHDGWYIANSLIVHNCSCTIETAGFVEATDAGEGEAA